MPIAHPHDAPPDRSSIAPFAAVAVGVAAFLVAAAWAAFARGPWYDEFYTLHVASPRFGTFEALRGHWLPDNHPPLFYALARASAFLGDSVEPRRLLNIGLAIAALLGGWAIVRRVPSLHIPAAALALTIAAQPLVLQESSELRSYFLSLCALAVLVLGLLAVWLENGERRSGQWILAVAALAAFNTHIVTTVIAGAVGVPFVGLALLRRDWRRFRAHTLPTIAAAAIFLAVTAIQLPLWLANTTSFWIPAGFDAARWPLEHTVMRTMWANPVVTLAGLAGAGLLAWRATRERRLPRDLEAIALLGCGAAFAAIMLIAIHLFRPLLIEKYLIGLIPVIGAGLALGFGQTANALGRKGGAALLAAALAATLWSLTPSVRQAATMPSWDGSAALVARVVRACPDTAVHIDPALVNGYTLSLSPADNLEVVPGAYRSTAARHGFALESAGSRRISAECPTLLWGEHDTSHLFTARKVLAHERGRGFVFDRLWLTRVGDGWVASDRPLPTR